MPIHSTIGAGSVKGYQVLGPPLYDLGNSTGVSFAVNSAVGYNLTQYSWKVPKDVTSISVVTIASGGGGGGGSGGANRGSGGGGGGLSFRNNITVTPGETLTINLGKGGGGANVPSDPPGQTGDGQDGFLAEVKRGNTILVKANPGTKGFGVNSSTGSGGAGGTSVDANYGGGTGGNGLSPGNNGYDGAGGNAGTYAGTSAGSGTQVGGSGRDVFGPGTVGPATWMDGEDYGGGGAGSNQTGGPGGDGRVRIMWDTVNTREFPNTRASAVNSLHGEYVYTNGQSGESDGTFTPAPTWGNFVIEAKLVASDAQLSDWFGNSVSISDDGNTIVIGAYQEDDTATGAGSAYIYTRSGTNWTQIQKIQAGDAQNSDEFGTSVKISGDGNTMIIGADKEDTNGNWAGSAYIFTKSGSSWSQQAKIQPTDSTTEQFFGKSVSISDDGNTAIIGAPGQSTGPAAAYIFTRSGTTWSQEAKISSPVDPTASYFGGSVDISDDGNTAIIGYSFEDTTAGVDAGAAYIYTRSGTTWSQEAKLESDDAEASDLFGVAVSISGDGNTVVVGATGEDTAWDNSTQANAGAAYVFARSGSTWSQEGKLQGNIVQTNTSFGHSVSISDDGNTVIVGAYRADAGYSNTGMSFLFTRSGTTWNRIIDINALFSDRQTNDYFGYSIAICGDGHTIVSGAYQDDTTVTDAGSAWVFTKGP